MSNDHCTVVRAMKNGLGINKTEIVYFERY